MRHTAAERSALLLTKDCGFRDCPEVDSPRLPARQDRDAAGPQQRDNPASGFVSSDAARKAAFFFCAYDVLLLTLGRS